MEKVRVVRDVMRDISSLDPPGRFLVMVAGEGEEGGPPSGGDDDEGEICDGAHWTVAKDTKAFNKTSQSLREAVLDIQRAGLSSSRSIARGVSSVGDVSPSPPILANNGQFTEGLPQAYRRMAADAAADVLNVAHLDPVQLKARAIRTVQESQQKLGSSTPLAAPPLISSLLPTAEVDAIRAVAQTMEGQHANTIKGTNQQEENHLQHNNFTSQDQNSSQQQQNEQQHQQQHKQQQLLLKLVDSLIKENQQQQTNQQPQQLPNKINQDQKQSILSSTQGLSSQVETFVQQDYFLYLNQMLLQKQRHHMPTIKQELSIEPSLLVQAAKVAKPDLSSILTQITRLQAISESQAIEPNNKHNLQTTFLETSSVWSNRAPTKDPFGTPHYTLDTHHHNHSSIKASVVSLSDGGQTSSSSSSSITPKKKATIALREGRHSVKSPPKVCVEEHYPPASKKRGVGAHSHLHRHSGGNSFGDNKRVRRSQEWQNSFKSSSVTSSVSFSGDGEVVSLSGSPLPSGSSGRGPPSFVGRTEFRCEDGLALSSGSGSENDTWSSTGTGGNGDVPKRGKKRNIASRSSSGSSDEGDEKSWGVSSMTTDSRPSLKPHTQIDGVRFSPNLSSGQINASENDYKKADCPHDLEIPKMHQEGQIHPLTLANVAQSEKDTWSSNGGISRNGKEQDPGSRPSSVSSDEGDDKSWSFSSKTSDSGSNGEPDQKIVGRIPFSSHLPSITMETSTDDVQKSLQPCGPGSKPMLWTRRTHSLTLANVAQTCGPGSSGSDASTFVDPFESESASSVSCEAQKK